MELLFVYVKLFEKWNINLNNTIINLLMIAPEDTIKYHAQWIFYEKVRYK